MRYFWCVLIRGDATSGRGGRSVPASGVWGDRSGTGLGRVPPQRMVGSGARRLGTFGALVLAALTVSALAGCAIKHPTANLVNGKVLFSSKCGTCHTLAHASSTGTIGPNLDDAFRQDRADGVKSTSIEGLVSYWIQYPSKGGAMPAGLYKGQSAQDVAAYVASVAAVPGQDTGALAAAGGVKGTNAAAGKLVFTGIGGCGGCHVLSAAGTSGTVGPNLDTRLRSDCASPASKPVRGATLQQCIHTAIVKPYAYLPPGYSAGIMPNNFDKTLSPSQIQALVAFLSSASK
jgi:mono/diheme cytochrome c family protein